MVINHLNASLASTPPALAAPPAAGGEGEGEGEAAPDAASFVLALTAPQIGQDDGEPADSTPVEVLAVPTSDSPAGDPSADTTLGETTTSERPLARRLAELEAETEAAADEVFATLGQILRSRFGRR
jgi:hypothetical protein